MMTTMLTLTLPMNTKKYRLHVLCVSVCSSMRWWIALISYEPNSMFRSFVGLFRLMFQHAYASRWCSVFSVHLIAIYLLTEFHSQSFSQLCESPSRHWMSTLSPSFSCSDMNTCNEFACERVRVRERTKSRWRQIDGNSARGQIKTKKTNKKSPKKFRCERLIDFTCLIRFVIKWLKREFSWSWRRCNRRKCHALTPASEMRVRTRTEYILNVSGLRSFAYTPPSDGIYRSCMGERQICGRILSGFRSQQLFAVEWHK